jgi:hypothetical protein
MKRLPTFALLVAGLTLPICAQRSAPRGGFSGHSAPSFRGGFSASAPHSFTGAPGYVGSRSVNMSPGFRRNVPTNYMARPTYSAANSYRRPYRPPYRDRARVRFVVPVWNGWVGSGFLGYPDTTSYDDFATQPNYTEPYEPQPSDAGQPMPPNPYQAPTELSHPLPAQESEDAVTLVFKDGRPPEQIHNYILTRTTLYVRDERRHDIPLDQLDLAATQKVNLDAGVDFQLPDAPR